MSILVVADHDNAELKPATLVVVAAAQAIGGDIDVLVAGEGCGAVAEAASKVAGVAKVLCADNAAYGHQLAENIAPLVAELGANYSHILTAHTTVGKNFLPRVAALLDVAQISDIQGVESPDTFKLGYLQAEGSWAYAHRPDLFLAVNLLEQYELIASIFERCIDADEDFGLDAAIAAADAILGANPKD